MGLILRILPLEEDRTLIRLTHWLKIKNISATIKDNLRNIHKITILSLLLTKFKESTKPIPPKIIKIQTPNKNIKMHINRKTIKTNTNRKTIKMHTNQKNIKKHTNRKTIRI